MDKKWDALLNIKKIYGNYWPRYCSLKVYFGVVIKRYADSEECRANVHLTF